LAKIFALAALAAMSLGIGIAITQLEVSGNCRIDYRLASIGPRVPVTVQAGSSDVRSTQPAIDYNTLGNSG
jgi:hypothetical protein